MALIEKALAEQLVDIRAAIALGHEYTPAADLERALQDHLDREQWWRGQMGRMADTIEALGVDRAGRTVRGGA